MNYIATNSIGLSHENIGKKILKNLGEEKLYYPELRMHISKKIQDLLLQRDYQPYFTSKDYKNIEDEVVLGLYKEKYPNIQSMSDVEKVVELEKENEDINKQISQLEIKLEDIVTIQVPDFVQSSVFLNMKLEDFLSDSFFTIDSKKLHDDSYEEALFDKVKQSQILMRLFPNISVFRRASTIQEDFNFSENVSQIKEFFLKNSYSQSQTLGENIQYILSGEKEKEETKKEKEELLSKKKMIDLQIEEFYVSEKQSDISHQETNKTEDNNKFNIIKREEVILSTLHPEYKVDYAIYNRYKGVVRFDKTPIQLPGEFLSEHFKRLLGDLYHGQTIEFFAFIQELRSIYSDDFIHASLTNAVCNKIKSDPVESIRFIFNNLDKMDDYIIKNFYDNMIANNGVTVSKEDIEGLTLDSKFFDFVIQHNVFFSQDALKFLRFRKSLQHHSRSEEIQQELGYDYETVGKIIHGEGGKYSIALADKFTRKLDNKAHNGAQREAHFYLLHSYLDTHNVAKIRSLDFDGRVGTKRLRMNIENNLAHFEMLDVFNQKYSNLNPEKNYTGPFSILSSLKNPQKQSIEGKESHENAGNENKISDNGPEIEKIGNYVDTFFNDAENITQSKIEIFLTNLWEEFLQLGQKSLAKSIGKKEKGFESVPFYALLQTDNLPQYIDFLYYHFPDTYKKEMEDMKKKSPYISNTELKYSIFHDHAKKFQSRLKKLEAKFLKQKLSEYISGISSFQELQKKLSQDNNMTDLDKVVFGIPQENVKIKIYHQTGEGTMEADIQTSDNYGKFSYLLIEMQKKGYDIQDEDIFVSKNDYYVCKIHKYNITLIASNNGGNIFLFPGFEMVELLEDETLRDLVEAYDGIEKRFNYDYIERSIGEILFLIENSPTTKNKTPLLKEFVDYDAEEMNEMTQKSLRVFQYIFSQLPVQFENGIQLRDFITDWNNELRNYTVPQQGKYFNIIQSCLHKGYNLNDLYLKSFNNSSSKDLSEIKIIQGLGGKQSIVLKSGYSKIVQTYLELLINDSQKARVFEGEFFRSIPKRPQIDFLLNFIANNISEVDIGELNASFKNNCKITFVNGLRMRRGSQGKTGMLNSLGNVLCLWSGDVGNLLKIYSDRKKFQNEVFSKKLTIIQAIELFGQKYKHTFDDVDHLGFFLKVNPYISEEEQNNQIIINSQIQEILEKLKQTVRNLYNKNPISQEEFITEFNNSYISPAFCETYFPTYKKWKMSLSSEETQLLIDNISIVESFIGTHFHGENIEGKTKSLKKTLKKVILDMVFLEIGETSNILGEQLTIEYKKSNDNSDDIDSEE